MGRGRGRFLLGWRRLKAEGKHSRKREEKRRERRKGERKREKERERKKARKGKREKDNAETQRTRRFAERKRRVLPKRENADCVVAGFLRLGQLGRSGAAPLLEDAGRMRALVRAC